MTQVSQLSSGLKHKFMVAVFVMLAAMLPATANAQDTTAKDTKPSPAPVTQSGDDVQRLSAEVSRLKADLAKLEQYRNIDCTRDVMIKEEDRIRQLQKQLVDYAALETALEKRLDEIEEEQRPDRIERALAGVGSVKPEADREAITTRLSNEKRHIQSQLDTLRAARTRIPPLIANAEESIAGLKQRMAELRSRPGFAGPGPRRPSSPQSPSFNRCLQPDGPRP